MSVELLKQRIIAAGVIDPVGVHHEFQRGSHGRKIEQDVINESPLLLGMLAVETAAFIIEEYDQQPDLLVSVANGTTPLVEKVAELLGKGVDFAHTSKEPGEKPKLTEEAIRKIAGLVPKFALVIEDTGTTGFSSMVVAEALLELGVERVEVLNMWQRTPELICLADADIVYKSMIVDYEMVPTYAPDECEHCKDHWLKIPYPRS